MIFALIDSFANTDSHYISIAVGPSFTHTESQSTLTTVDGSGLLTTPNGTFSVLRVKRQANQMSKEYSNGVPVDSNTSTDNSYEFWAKNQGWPVLKVRTDSAWVQLWGVEFLNNAVPVAIAEEFQIHFIF